MRADATWQLLGGHSGFPLCDFGSIKVDVTNVGNVTSDFIVLEFLAGEYGPQPYTLESLAAYTRLKNIKPETTTGDSFEITLGTSARVDDSGNTVLYPGTYKALLDVPAQDIIPELCEGYCT
ncbi:hypothetical protein F5Y11DRAFT_328412 [Daldinia sp. FL1419]|nr:hypothetical protein F5Y11DRAFT_328412 [Daldinia sp. FL1419]